jgi:hypothetical protein
MNPSTVMLALPSAWILPSKVLGPGFPSSPNWTSRLSIFVVTTIDDLLEFGTRP